MSTSNVVPLNTKRDPVMKSPIIVGTPAQIAACEEAELVSSFALADRAAKHALDQKDQARDRMLAHLAKTGRSIAMSKTALVKLSKSTRASLDSKRIKVEMGEAWYDERCKICDVSTVSVTWLE